MHLCTSGMLASSRKMKEPLVARIHFYKDPVKERLRRSKNIRLRQLASPSEELTSTFLQSLAEGQEHVVGLCAFKDFSDKFVSTQPIPTKVCMPSSLRTLYRDTHEKLDRAHLMAKYWVHKQTGVTEQQRKCQHAQFGMSIAWVESLHLPLMLLLEQ